jgi:hypothetical protein
MCIKNAANNLCMAANVGLYRLGEDLRQGYQRFLGLTWFSI